MNTGGNRPSAAGAQHQCGFTVIELVACVVILAIMAAVAAPLFANNQTFGARGYADELGASLRYAQKVAIASGCSARVTVNAAGYNGRQQQNFVGCNGGGAWARPIRRSDGAPLTGLTPTGIGVNPNTTVEFLRTGNLAGGAVAINVGAYLVNVDNITGRVWVQ